MLDLEAQSALGFVFWQAHFISGGVYSHPGTWGLDVSRDVKYSW